MNQVILNWKVYLIACVGGVFCFWQGLSGHGGTTQAPRVAASPHSVTTPVPAPVPTPMAPVSEDSATEAARPSALAPPPRPRPAQSTTGRSAGIRNAKEHFDADEQLRRIEAVYRRAIER
jgi:hypothetical protein